MMVLLVLTSSIFRPSTICPNPPAWFLHRQLIQHLAWNLEAKALSRLQPVRLGGFLLQTCRRKNVCQSRQCLSAEGRLTEFVPAVFS